MTANLVFVLNLIMAAVIVFCKKKKEKKKKYWKWNMTAHSK